MLLHHRFNEPTDSESWETLRNPPEYQFTCKETEQVLACLEGCKLPADLLAKSLELTLLLLICEEKKKVFGDSKESANDGSGCSPQNTSDPFLRKGIIFGGSFCNWGDTQFSPLKNSSLPFVSKGNYAPKVLVVAIS